MADYNPPLENLPIFDSQMFLTGDEFITQKQGDKRYLRYPNAQGTENLQTVNIAGTLTANGISNFTNTINSSGIANFTNDINSSDVININDATLANQNKICLNLESQGNPLSRLRFSLNPSAGNFNPIVKSNDIAMYYGTSDANPASIAIVPVGATSCGIRMSQTGIGIGSGGTGIAQLNALTISPTLFNFAGNGTNQNLTFENNILMTNPLSINRQITGSYLRLQDITSGAPIVQMYGSGTNIAMDNNIIMTNAISTNRQISTTFLNFNDINTNTTQVQCFLSVGGVLFFDNNFNGGQFAMVCNDAVGTQVSVLQGSTTVLNIRTVLPPTSLATIPPNDNTTALATTAWVQSLTSIGRTQTVQFTSTTTFNIPTGVIGIGIRMIGQGGVPGNNSPASTPPTSWYSGGTGGGASSIVSNGMIGIIGGTSVSITIDAVGVTFTTNSIVVCNVRNGNTGGNATTSSAGVAAASQTVGSSNASFGSFTLLAGSGGIIGTGPNLFQSVSGIPVIPAGATNSAPIYQPFGDGIRGCGQRYVTFGFNSFQTSSTPAAGGIVYLTYYYI